MTLEKISVRNADPIKQFLKSIPPKLRGVATIAASWYFVGDGSHGLKRYPPYKQVTRKQAYGKTFVSDKQRRKVMGMIASGKIDPGVPHRTGNYQRSWSVKYDGTKSNIYGTLPHAQWPDRLAQKIGWQPIVDIIAANTKGAIRAAQTAVNDWIKANQK